MTRAHSIHLVLITTLGIAVLATRGEACPRWRRTCHYAVPCAPAVSPLAPMTAFDPDPQPPKRPPNNVDPKAKAAIAAFLSPTADSESHRVDSLRRNLERLQRSRDSASRNLKSPVLSNEERERLKVSLQQSEEQILVAESLLHEVNERLLVSGRTSAHSLDRLGPGAKPVLREMVAANAPARIPAANALEAIRRKQLGEWFLGMTGTTPESQDLFGDLMNLPDMPEQLEEAADGILDAAWLSRKWRRDLNAAIATKRPVENAAVAAWLLLGARPDVKLDKAAAGDLRFLDLAENPALAKAMRDKDSARPFRHLVGGWIDRQGENPPEEVKRLVKPFLDGWR